MKATKLLVALGIIAILILPSAPADEKVNFKRLAKAEAKKILSDNAGTFERWVKKTFTKASEIPLENHVLGYKVFQVEIITTPLEVEFFGERPILYIAVGQAGTSIRYGILTHPGTPSEQLLGWYDVQVS